MVAKYWRPSNGYDPIAELEKLRASADVTFPLAFSPHAPLLPVAYAFVHALAGLVQLADWVGSSAWTRDRQELTALAWSDRTLREIGLDPTPYRTTAAETRNFEAVFERSPYPHQLVSGDSKDRLVILEAETGSGKTEAALWRFLKLFFAGDVDGLYFALPTRTAAAQLHTRVERSMKAVWGSQTPPVIMAAPGYLDDVTVGGLPPSADALDAPEADTRSNRSWAAEHPKRFFSAMIGVGTIDQALLAALRVKHAHLRASCLMRHLLVVDEVHASDPYMRRLLEQLLRDHLAAGGHAMLLSATLGAESRQSLIEAAAGGRPRDVTPISLGDAMTIPYPLISTNRRDHLPIVHEETSRAKAVHVRTESLLDEPERIARIAIEAAIGGAKVLIVRNTVSGAVAVQRALESIEHLTSPLLFTVAGQRTLHHGRFAREDRRALDRAATVALGRNRPSSGLIVVGTQTLEQSLDIDADFLITDLCPVDVLLQRIGRLHRHRTERDGRSRERPPIFEKPTCAVLVPADGLANFLPARRVGGIERHGLGHSLRAGIVQGIYADVTVLEATRRLLLENPVWTIPAMNRFLVESGTHSEALNALIESIPIDQRNVWQEHQNRVLGNELAQVGTASNNVLRKDRDFMEHTLGDVERISTRLGADDRLIQFPANTIGPFAELISQIAVPGWMLSGVDTEAAVTIAKSTSGAELGVQVGDRRFLYGTHGLHPLDVNL